MRLCLCLGAPDREGTTIQTPQINYAGEHVLGLAIWTLQPPS